MKIVKYRLFFALVFISSIVFAQNPIAPPGVYVADPAAHIWKDGKIYVYCSVDESFDYYCSHNYHVLSTDNMKDWTLHKNVFSSSGPNDKVPYSNHKLAAPDCMYKDGKYYLYYCTQDKAYREGVAVSVNPIGPFSEGKNLLLGRYKQIDPGAFVDDDGQAYYVWGQFSMKMAKLKPDMLELDSSSIMDNVLTEQKHYFHEGAHMVKRDDLYYIIYTLHHRVDKATCIGYATSKNPMGPYKYGGVIIDNLCSDPGVWNNHGSIEQLNGKWYVFYHRSTHGTERKRRACVEPITFNADGSINEVEMTSQGAGEPLKATTKIDAYRVCLLHGKCYLELYDANKETLTGIKQGDRAAFKYINFEKGVTKATVKVRPGKAKGKILISLDRPWWGGSHGSVDIPEKAEGSDEWIEIRVDLKQSIKGTHALWLTFNGEGDDLFAFDWIRFE
jgi:hypothetical protein